MIIGISDTLGSEHKFKMYIDWLRSGSPEVECRILSHKLDNLKDLQECDAFILTGGHDVEPGLYGGPLDHPKIVDVDPRRDSFEQQALDIALTNEIPVLGICRGLQLANVHFGGTLIPDIEEAGYRSHKSGKEMDNLHKVTASTGSFLHHSTGTTEGIVNTSHHQSVKVPGAGLKVTATSDDGIIEALEFERPDKQFLLLVQWHPERMKDPDNPFARNILKEFLYATQQTQQ